MLFPWQMANHILYGFFVWNEGSRCPAWTFDFKWLKSERCGAHSSPQVLPAGVPAATVLIMHEGQVFMPAVHLHRWKANREGERMKKKTSTGRTVFELHLNSVIWSDQIDVSSNVKWSNVFWLHQHSLDLHLCESCKTIALWLFDILWNAR